MLLNKNRLNKLSIIWKVTISKKLLELNKKNKTNKNNSQAIMVHIILYIVDESDAIVNQRM